MARANFNHPRPRFISRCTPNAIRCKEESGRKKGRSGRETVSLAKVQFAIDRGRGRPKVQKEARLGQSEGRAPPWVNASKTTSSGGDKHPQLTRRFGAKIARGIFLPSRLPDSNIPAFCHRLHPLRIAYYDLGLYISHSMNAEPEDTEASDPSAPSDAVKKKT